MAVKSSIRQIFRKIAEVIADYVSGEGLERGEIALMGLWNERTEQVSLTLVTSRRLSAEDLVRWYRDILNRLRQSVDEPGLPPFTWNIGLVVTSTLDLDREFALFSVPDDEEDVTDFLQDEMDAGWPSPSAASSSPSKVGGSASS